MGIASDTLHVLLHESSSWLPQLQRHLVLSVVALLVSIAVGVPVGAWLTRREQWAFAVTSIANLGRTVPSLALLALVYPFVGTGFAPSVIALIALGVPPVLLATYTGIREVSEDVRDAAAGMGLTSVQRLVQAELPMGSAVILSGVRTAAVQIVASATLASLIGGGGLGEMIMAGLTNLRYDLLVAGAVLVALVAAGTEVLFTVLERRALPAGIRMQRQSPQAEALGYVAGGGVSMRHWQLVTLAVLVASATLIGAGSFANGRIAGIGTRGIGATGPLPKVVIGTKDFTESIVLGELYAQALEAQGHPVERRFNLGATAVADSALRSGDIDMYPEYTGTALVAVLGEQLPTIEGGGGTNAKLDVKARALAIDRAVDDAVRRGYAKRDVEMLTPTPFSNGNAIVVSAKTAKRYHLETLSDLAKVSSKLDFGSIPGFDTRADGLPLLKRVYGIRFNSAKSYSNGIKYSSLSDGKVDAVYGFETDGQIAAGKLVVLTDDRAAWPPYHAAPMVSRTFAKRAGPAFAATVDQVSSLLDAKTMRRLNAAVDEDKREPADVARAFLKSHDMLSKGKRPTVRIASKDFTEQFVLGELYAQALEARGYPVERHLGLGATAVADSAVRTNRIDMYPEYTGTSWTAVLKKSVKSGTTPEAIWRGVEQGYAKRGLDVLRPTPFSNGNAIVVTKATADTYHLTTLSDLAKVSKQLKFGAIPGSDVREDGLPLLAREYGMTFGTVKSFSDSLKYQELLKGGIDVVYGFETDGQIAASKLVALRDDRQAWPAYQAAPVVSKAFEQRVGPDFAATIDHVSSLLDAKTMRRLNTAVDQGKREPADVAHDYLVTQGLVAK
ncbi:MAG: ABC transporter permease subunit [Thermoleophilia bacterium]|nr:ABC transporter permease subunit [Thermoleophilia bacterium]